MLTLLKIVDGARHYYHFTGKMRVIRVYEDSIIKSIKVRHDGEDYEFTPEGGNSHEASEWVKKNS